MKKTHIIILFLSLFFSSKIVFSRTFPKREFRAAWVSTVWNVDYPSASGLSVATQKSEFINQLNQLKSSGINVVFIQVRPSCDALYDSSLEPWSQWLTGTPQNTSPSPYYDPLAFYVMEAHKRGMELHAWVNPYRAASNFTAQSFSATHVTNAHPSWCVTYGTKKLLNPGMPAVRSYVKDVVMEIVENYDIDGLHFDDYFYPYPESGLTFNDAAAFSADPRGFTNLDNWRRDNVNIFINTINDSLKAVKPWVRFGVSPFGIWKSGVPAGITGLSSYFDIYCDPIQWLQQGNVDYIMPQLYWVIGGSQDFTALSNWWGTQAQTNSRHCFDGIATYRLDPGSGNWSNTEIKNQIDVVRSTPSKVQGYGCFSSKSIVTNIKNIRDTLRIAKNKYISLLPALTWNNSVAPNLVTGITHQILSSQVKLNWNLPIAASDGDLARYFVIYRFSNGASIDLSNPANIAGRTNQDTIAFVDNFALAIGETVTYCITSVDRYSNESAPMYYNICNNCDSDAPTTTIAGTNNWKTTNFTTTYADVDDFGGTGVEKGYYNAEYFDGTKWSANPSRGFAFDDFEASSIPSQWTTTTGIWSINTGDLTQSDVSTTNTNAYSLLNQSLSNRIVYNFRAAIGGSGASRRAGIHLLASDPTLSERGNSLLVWFRLDDDKIQLYQTAGNALGSILQATSFDFTADQFYDFSIMYDRITGVIRVYIDGALATSFVFTTPYSSGDFVSFRTGNARLKIEDFRVLRSRANTTGILVGAAISNDLLFQNLSVSNPGGRINSFCNDSAYNIGAIQSTEINVDWSAPLFLSSINDGLGSDVNTSNSISQLSANWSAANDPNSGLTSYFFGIGTNPGTTDVLNFIPIGNVLSHTQLGLSLAVGTTYFISVKAENGAGLFSDSISSNGQLIVPTTTPPVAAFSAGTVNVCSSTSYEFDNASNNADSYIWNIPGATPNFSTELNPSVIFPNSGAYSVELIATGTGGTDTLEQILNVVLQTPSTSLFLTSSSILTLPNAIATFSNNSIEATSWMWHFGDGETSSDLNPFHQYNAAGIYTVSLITSSGDACPDDTSFAEIAVGNLGIGSLELINLSWVQKTNDLIVSGDLSSFENSTAILFDLQGRKMASKEIENDFELIFDISEVPSGVYFVKFVSNQEAHIRVIIMK